MIEGLYSAAAGMAAQQRRLDAVANDLANVNTTAYRRTRTSFRDLLYTQAGQGGAAGVSVGAGSASDRTTVSTQAGTISATGEPLDLALQGDGYLQVKGPNGETALTRSGSLTIDAQRRITTKDGWIVQPELKLPADASLQEIQVGGDGTVTAKGTRVGKLALVSVSAPTALTGLGDGRFLANAGSGAAKATTATTIVQGSLESSNVDMSDAMVDLLDSQRAYQMASKAIETQDQMWSIANEVKR